MKKQNNKKNTGCMKCQLAYLPFVPSIHVVFTEPPTLNFFYNSSSSSISLISSSMVFSSSLSLSAFDEASCFL